MNTLAENLIYLREKNDLTSTAVAKMLHMTQVGYYGYESNKSNPPLETLIKLADFYNVSIDFLLGREQTGTVFLDAVQTMKNLPPYHQKKAADYIRLLKLDTVCQMPPDDKKHKGDFYRNSNRKSGPLSIKAPSPGIAAHGGGIKEIDEEIREDLDNLSKSIEKDIE